MASVCQKEGDLTLPGNSGFAAVVVAAVMVEVFISNKSSRVAWPRELVVMVDCIYIVFKA